MRKATEKLWINYLTDRWWRCSRPGQRCWCGKCQPQRFGHNRYCKDCWAGAWWEYSWPRHHASDRTTAWREDRRPRASRGWSWGRGGRGQGGAAPRDQGGREVQKAKSTRQGIKGHRLEHKVSILLASAPLYTNQNCFKFKWGGNQ